MSELDCIDSIPTKVLIEVLTRRCSHALFIGFKGEEWNPNGYWWEIKGNPIMCDGLWTEMAELISIERRKHAPKEYD